MDISFLKNLKNELNPPQYEAVTHTHGPLLVLAGAGSGKTRVITYRIAYLIAEKKLAPWNILAVTFTNKAAREMKERISHILGGMPKGLWIGTFHSICARILRMDGEAAGIDPNFTIYDRADQTSAVKQAKEQCGLSKDKSLKPSAVIQQISKAKNRFEWPEQYSRNARGTFEMSVARIYAAYQALLRKNNALDFDDLIMETVRLFKHVPEVADVYRKRFQQILVDEYQDTNEPQYQLLRELTVLHKNICVVGDDDQSIYRWRGANVENILNFDSDFPDVNVIRLEQNYRSTKTILSAASAVIQQNQHRHKKTLWCDAEEGHKVGIVCLPDENSEAYWIGEEVERLHQKEKVPYGHIAIFFRVNAQSRLIEEEMVRRNIPYSLVGATAFYQRKEVKDILAYARLLVNPADSASFERIVNEPKRKLGSVSVQKLTDYAERAGLSILDAALKSIEAGPDSGLSPATRQAFFGFANMFEKWKVLSKEISLAELMARIVDQSGYKSMLSESYDPQDLSRLDNINELINAIAEAEEAMDRDSPTPLDALFKLQVFLEDSALVADVDQLKETKEAVVLMTVHSAKGLEFPHVIITGMEEGLFPHERSIVSDESEKDIEEERRLCYVGITRARKRLVFTYATSRRLYGDRQISFPSRFLEEIPEDRKEILYWGEMTDSTSVVNDEENEDEEGVPVSQRGQSKGRSDNHSFAPGEFVVHRTFGFGVVLDVEGSGPSTHIQVEFQEFGRKTLVLEFARLKKV